ncbi:MAG: trypsin-like peptidase domain-containing protein [Planctomycetota bacterium]
MPIPTAAAPAVRRCLFALIAAMAMAAPALAERPMTSRSDTVDLAGLEGSFRRVANRAAPGVVAITVGNALPPASADTRSAVLNYDKLTTLLGDGSRTVGTGFCVDARGYIVTNQHVIEGAKQIYVTTDTGRTLPAIVVATDRRGDLAVLKVPTSLPALSFAPPASRTRGQWVVAIGNPMGLAGRGEMSISTGIISATERTLPKLSRVEGRLYSGLIQTTAELNPGNSGGPIFDLEGRVVGVVTAVVLPQGEANGLGFALPADQSMQDRIATMIRGDKVRYGYLGVAGTAAQSRTARGGMVVTRVGAGTPAEGRIREGDVILALGGRPVNDEETFVRHVGSATTSTPVRLSLLRGGRSLDVSIRLAERPGQAGTGRSEQRLHFRGVTFKNAGEGRGCIVESVSEDSPLRTLVSGGLQFEQVSQVDVPNILALQSTLDRIGVGQLRFK